MRLLYFLSIVVLFSCQTPQSPPVITQQNSGTKSLLQAISVIDDNTVWVSGHKATYANTMNGGKTWNSFQISEADSLQFRDIEALNKEEILLMSAGPGILSQIRKSNDGGQSWAIKYLMDIDTGFLDCMAFWDDKTGVAYGDAAGGLFILRTEDSGDTWTRIDPSSLPKPAGKEGGFAASGSCVEIGDNGLGWIGTGAGDEPRVLITKDYGKTWQAANTPIIKGEAAGITSINFWNDNDGIVVGGDLAQSDSFTDNIATTNDGGATWAISGKPITKGSFYGNDVTIKNDQLYTFSCGPNGIDYSTDKGQTWSQLDTLNYWAVKVLDNGTGWTVGKDGRIAKITF
jgi:photosystem II stability/assembly factor-like uncharacterized protein